jgi:hypothetical protein
MVLRQIKEYLRTVGRAALTDLACRFNAEPEALRGMLETWMQKGEVRRLPAAACGGCCGCARSLPEIYEWVGTAGCAGAVKAGCSG